MAIFLECLEKMMSHIFMAFVVLAVSCVGLADGFTGNLSFYHYNVV